MGGWRWVGEYGRMEMSGGVWEGGDGWGSMGGWRWVGEYGRVEMGGGVWEGGDGREYGRVEMGGEWEGGDGWGSMGGSMGGWRWEGNMGGGRLEGNVTCMCPVLTLVLPGPLTHRVPTLVSMFKTSSAVSDGLYIGIDVQPPVAEKLHKVLPGEIFRLRETIRNEVWRMDILNGPDAGSDVIVQRDCLAEYSGETFSQFYLTSTNHCTCT